jgi:hypothetical protein
MTRRVWTGLAGTAVLIAAMLGGFGAMAQGDPSRVFNAATAAVRAPGTHVKIDLIGDSTQTERSDAVRVDGGGYARKDSGRIGARRGG